MSGNRRLRWLRLVLVAKAALTLFAWGLPALVAPMSSLRLLGVPTPDDALFLRLFGAVVTAFGVVYAHAYRDPVQNRLVPKVGILDNGLVTAVIVVFALFHDLRSAFVLVSALLTFLFFVAFLLLVPRAEAA